MKRIGFVVISLMLGSVLAGCGTSVSQGAVSPAQLDALIDQAANIAPNLQSGEKIKVTVFGEDRLSGEYEINPAGYVALPLAGTLKAAGLSQSEFESVLAKKFATDYLRDPKVTVEVSGFLPFYILGEVSKPGEYPYKGGLNVLSAIALAGGSTYRATENTILIQHRGESGFHEYPMLPKVPVLPGDLIRVPQRYF
jgi:polysaccharide export outer membrane protein